MNPDIKMIVTILFFSMLVGACGAAGGGADPVAMDGCKAALEGQIQCGHESVGGYPAVLVCSNVQGTYQWLVDEVCVHSCSQGACQGEDAGTSFVGAGDAGVRPHHDTVTGQLDTTGEGGQAIGDTAEVADTGLCDPGTPTCIDEHTQGICNELGTDYNASPCEGDTACDNGFCLPVICVPFDMEGVCIGPNSYSRCNEAGTEWEAAYCDQGYTCYNGMCVDYKCPPDQVICKGITRVSAACRISTPCRPVSSVQ